MTETQRHNTMIAKNKMICLHNKKKKLHLQSHNNNRLFENGAVAQSVEQRTENPCVAGSIPAHTTGE